MEKNRRDFLKAMGLGSGALFIQPAMALSQGLPAGSPARPGSSAATAPESGSGTFALREMTTDVLIAGGGMSGVCAALAAARNGAKVILIQNRSRLGGNASSEIRMHISGASALKQVWRESGILEELMLTESVINRQNSYEMLDYVLYDKIVSEENITLLLDTMLFDVQTEGDRVSRIKAYCSQTEEIYEITARFFADCTGDGTLASLAGAEYMRGREAKSKWGEPLGLEKADEITMGNSLLFMAQEHDSPMPFTPPAWARKYTFTDFKYRRIHSYEYGYWWIELGGSSDIIKDGQALRHELMAVVFGIWDYIKNSGNHPDSENWALSWFGLIPGKRESRRITGDYVMIQDDIQSPKLFEDRVAYGGWPLDDHLPDGMDDTSKSPFRSIPLKGPYSIPMRSLYSKSFKNLLMAGRNVSVSHIALSSTRVMATCSTLGQAVGTAMAYCLKEGLTPSQLCADKKHTGHLQQLLLRQDQSLLEVRNTDEHDLARSAAVTASGELPAGKAANVTDGVNRNIGDGSSHQWQAPVEGEPWIELRWPSAVALSTVEFTFDTGLNRFLRISGQKSVLENQIRGPQPETISDYKIELLLKGKTVYEEEIRDNYLRKKVHRFPQVSADAVRLVARKTHGDELARLFEIRCYA